MTTQAADERLYLKDDEELGVLALQDEGVRERHMGRYRKAIELAGRTGGVWVDFACGSGYGTEMLAGVAEWVVGADCDQEAIAYAHKHHYGPSRWFIVADELNVWNRLTDTLDVVVCVETLEHMEQGAQENFVQGAALYLAPEGVLVLACPIGNGGPSPCNPWHLHEPTVAELEQLLRRHFAVVTLETEEYESTSGPAVQAWATCRHA